MATLHRFEGSNVLEGTLVEEGVRAMWRIVCQADGWQVNPNRSS